jgi:hypothetical protein
MRLYEIDLGGARAVLSTIRGLKDRHGQVSELPFGVLKTALGDAGDVIGNGGRNSKELLLQLKNQIDPEGKLIADVTDDASIILSTEVPNNKQPNGINQPTSPSVSRMASHNAKSAIK